MGTSNRIRTVEVSSIRFVKELYPRLRPSDEVIERYMDALDNLPPIAIAKDGILVDGYHRWQAHLRAGTETITVEHLGDLSDAEIFNESIRRNSTHGHQLSAKDKKNLAGKLWATLAHLPAAERQAEIQSLLAVSERTVQEWTKDARKAEKDAQKDRAWDLWLDCHEQKAIAASLEVDEATVSRWLQERKSADLQPPASRQHFDVWNFGSDGSDGSYFGRMPVGIVENVLWLFTEPGDIVFDPFAGSGTTIEVGKAMGRRVWAADRASAEKYPHLPIHTHDIIGGWPTNAPRKADLILLDPPYWQQAEGRYSDDAADLGNMSLDAFYKAWADVVKECSKHLADDGVVAYIISPTQLEDGSVVDHATDMLKACWQSGLTVKRRIIATYSTQQATGQQVEWARDNRRLLKLYRDLVVMGK